MNMHKSIEETVAWINSFGADPTGGTSRLLYSESWVAAQKGLKSRFEEIGMTARFDAIGNLFGRVEGTEFPEETILSGSHVDTVKNGGKLDGQFGIIGAYLAIKYLLETYGRPKRSLEVVSFAEEEGSRFPYTYWGSKNFLGIACNKETLDIVDSEGIKFQDAMRNAGFNYDENENKKIREDIKAFIELHIEQGNVLEKTGRSVGVVTGIVGQRRYKVILKGQANHAGTTPMGYRKDAVYGFSKICTGAIEKAKEKGDPLVLTFGKVVPKPNVVNVVPGEVEFSIDCRHTDKQVIADFTEELEKDMKAIAKELDLDISIEMWMDELPVPMDEKITEMLKNICDKEKLSYMVMHSGAGHDAQMLAQYVPSGMIFVPSIEGISHNPAEDTKTEDMVNGIMLLAKAFYELAYTE